LDCRSKDQDKAASGERAAGPAEMPGLTPTSHTAGETAPAGIPLRGISTGEGFTFNESDDGLDGSDINSFLMHETRVSGGASRMAPHSGPTIVRGGGILLEGIRWIIVL
jgi:hypothetical protein